MKILVVDNDRILNRFLSENLSKKGYEVFSATDGLEALKLLHERSYDLLLIDYIMPNVDGKTLCRFIRNMPALSESYIVLMSAIAAEKWQDHQSVGADVYLAKVPLKEMMKNIVWVIENRQEAAALCAAGNIIGSENLHPRGITKELLASRHHLKLILNKTTEGIIEIDANGQVVFANPSILALLKLKEYEIIGRHFLDLFAETAQKRVQKLWETSGPAAPKIGSDNPLEIGNNLVTMVIVPIEDNAHGQSALVIFTDITHPKRIEEELRDTNTFLERILNSSFSTSIIATDLEQNILFWNKGAENIFGYQADEVLGKNIGMIYPGPEEREQARMIREQICRDKAEKSTEIRELTKEGGEKWFKINLCPILDDSGEVFGIQGMGEDITKRKILEKQLQQTHKMKSIGTLASGIAHEFNNIMAIVISNAELALKHISDWSPAADCLSEIHTASLRAKETVRQLLSFSRHCTVKPKPVNAAAIVRESLSLLRAALPANIEMQTDIACKSAIIRADAFQVNQIIMNLGTNAYQAMAQQGGTIHVALQCIAADDDGDQVDPELAAGTHLRLSVRDTGPGIDPEIMDCIFDPYFTTKKIDEGSGLGLWVVYGIVQNCGGRIKVDSTPGQGTTVSILLPLVTDGVSPAVDEDQKNSE